MSKCEVIHELMKDLILNKYFHNNILALIIHSFYLSNKKDLLLSNYSKGKYESSFIQIVFLVDLKLKPH